MNTERDIRDPHLSAFTEAAGDALADAISSAVLPLPELHASALAELLGHVVPRPILMEALATVDES